MFFILFAIAFIPYLLYSLLTFIITLDCDITLYFAERYGSKIQKLNNKVIWITGASSGIGEALAYDLASVGARLVLSGTNDSKLNEVRERCISRGKLKESDVICVPFDIGDLKCHKEQLHKVLHHFRCIDILVNNAGRSLRAMSHETDIEIDKSIFQINVFGVINLSRLVLNHWYSTKQKGHFVVTSSTTGKMGVVNAGAYSASKHALHRYFETIRQEGYAQGIRVTFACPVLMKCQS